MTPLLIPAIALVAIVGFVLLVALLDYCHARGAGRSWRGPL